MERSARPTRSLVCLVGSALLMLRAPVALAVPDLTTVQEIFVGAKSFSTIFVGSVAGSPDGTSIYALDQERQQLQLFRRDAATGLLAKDARVLVPGSLGSNLPGALAVSADGKNVYLAKLGEDSVSMFARDPGSGRLDFVEEVAVSAGSARITVSPDGAHAYVSGGGISVFSRDGVTGQLTFVGLESGGGRLRFSSDGAHLYAAGGALDVWSRNPVSGDLSLVQTYLGVPGITSAADVAIAPGGQHVYVTNDSPTASISLHERDGVTGALTFVSEITPGGREIAISPDGARVFVHRYPGPGAPTVLEGFARDDVTGALTPLGGTEIHDLRGLVPAADSSGFVHGATSDTVFTARELHVECPPAPVGGCLQPTIPGMGSLKVIKKAADALNVKATVKWRWSAGSAFGAAEIGDLAAANDYALCLYDASSDPQPLKRFVMRAGACVSGPCWQQLVDGRVKYRDKGGLPDGVKAAILEPGAAGTSSIRLAGKGFDFPHAIEPPWTLPVVAQLHTAAGVCWEATYSTALRNENVPPAGIVQRFQAVAD